MKKIQSFFLGCTTDECNSAFDLKITYKLQFLTVAFILSLFLKNFSE
jgi:hypothetical protein